MISSLHEVKVGGDSEAITVFNTGQYLLKTLNHLFIKMEIIRTKYQVNTDACQVKFVKL